MYLHLKENHCLQCALNLGIRDNDRMSKIHRYVPFENIYIKSSETSDNVFQWPDAHGSAVEPDDNRTKQSRSEDRYTTRGYVYPDGEPQGQRSAGDNIYHPQTKFAKVMFSQVFVYPRGGGGALSRGSLSRKGLCSGGVSVQDGSLFRGQFLSRRRVSVKGGSAQRGLCPKGSPSRGFPSMGTPCMVKNRWYASYWSVFLFFLCFESVVQRALFGR